MLIKVSSIITALDDAKDFGADCVISIVDQNTVVPNFGVRNLIVRADDTDVFTDTFAPRLSDVDAIFRFASQLGNNVLVHCVGGISRSTAIGIGLLVADGMSVNGAVDCVHSDRPNLAPNRLILGLIDRHLNMNGNFVKQVQAKLDTLPKYHWLWCADCKKHFIDGNHADCPSGNWR